LPCGMFCTYFCRAVATRSSNFCFFVRTRAPEYLFGTVFVGEGVTRNQLGSAAHLIPGAPGLWSDDVASRGSNRFKTWQQSGNAVHLPSRIYGVLVRGCDWLYCGAISVVGC